MQEQGAAGAQKRTEDFEMMVRVVAEREDARIPVVQLTEDSRIPGEIRSIGVGGEESFVAGVEGRDMRAGTHGVDQRPRVCRDSGPLRRKW